MNRFRFTPCAVLLAVALQGAGPAPIPPPPSPCDPLTVFFAAESAELGDRERAIVREAARLALDRRITAAVDAHSDAAESDPDALAVRRAKAVTEELVRDGVMARDIEALSLGSMESPFPNPKSDADRAQNRRVAIDLCVD